MTVWRDGDILLGFPILLRERCFSPPTLLHLGGRLPISGGNLVLLVSLLGLYKIPLYFFKICIEVLKGNACHVSLKENPDFSDL